MADLKIKFTATGLGELATHIARAARAARELQDALEAVENCKVEVKVEDK